MNKKSIGPPRWAESLLKILLRPSDRESTSGDLLEEYRAARYPALGRFRAAVWYVKQVLSVLLHWIWPCLLAATAMALLSFVGHLLWSFSPVPFPAMTPLHSLVYVWAGYCGSYRTRLLKTATLAGAVTSVYTMAITLVALAIQTPSLVFAPFSKPFIFVILSVFLMSALGWGIVMGTIGGMIGRWVKPLQHAKFELSDR